MNQAGPFLAGTTPGAAPALAEDDTLPVLPRGCAWTVDGSVLVSLTRPAVSRFRDAQGEREDRRETLLMHPLTGGDLIDAMSAKGEAARTLFLFGRSLGENGAVAEALVRGLDARDFVRLSAVISVFTVSGQTTGP